MPTASLTSCSCWRVTSTSKDKARSCGNRACIADENVLPIPVPMSPSHFAFPAEDRYFEDYAPGSVFEYGEIQVDEADIIEFARRFDPQDMHVDPAKAASGRFGGLFASGWHTAALMMR